MPIPAKATPKAAAPRRAPPTVRKAAGVSLPTTLLARVRATRRPVLGGLAALVVAVPLAGGAAWRVAHRGQARDAASVTPPKPRPVADDPAANPGRFVELTFDAYAQRSENDLVARTIMPSLGSTRAHPIPFRIGLADVTAQGAFMIFVQLVEPRFCGDGCRTLAYRWNGGTWRLVADEVAARVVARRDVFVYRTKDHGDVAWHWRGDGFEREPL